MTDLAPVTTRLGFGTAALGRSLSRHERVRLLETAYDAGIRYFDTAPLYGGGAAEEALGRFLQGRTDVIVATKAGIQPLSTPRRLGSRLSGAAAARSGLFAPAEVRASLHGSLRRLRTSRVDRLLLHEVAASQVTDDLLETLNAFVGEGLVAQLGIATGSTETQRILGRRERFPDVVQLPANETLSVSPRVLVVHSAIVRGSGPVAERLVAALRRSPSALVLFGSRDTRHVVAAVDSVRSLRP